MKRKYRLPLLIMSFFLLAPFFHPLHSMGEEGYEPLPGPGKKCPIGQDYYFKYTFDQKPMMGTVILKVVVFDKNDRQYSGLKIFGDSGMPSMMGHHDSGDVAFALNKKGDYLLPVNLVMPGVWEIKLTFLEGDKPIYRGAISLEL
jgi:hypothetical protein